MSEQIFLSQKWKEAERSLFCLEQIASILDNEDLLDYVDKSLKLYHSTTAAKMLIEVNKGLELAKTLSEYGKLKDLENEDLVIWGDSLHTYFINN